MKRGDNEKPERRRVSYQVVKFVRRERFKFVILHCHGMSHQFTKSNEFKFNSILNPSTSDKAIIYHCQVEF